MTDNITIPRATVKQALEAIDLYQRNEHCEDELLIAGHFLRTALEQQQAEPVHGDIRALKYRIHELEGEVMGYKRMLDVAEAASQPQQQAEPVSTHRITSWGHCGVCRHDRIPGEGCARQECPDSPHRKPLTDAEIDALAVDEEGLPNSHLEFARAIEAAHGIKEGA